MHTWTSPVQKGEGPGACNKHVMWAVCDVLVQPHLYFGLFGWGMQLLKLFPRMHTWTSPVQKGEGPGACPMHKHVMLAVCDVSVVQPHLYFGLFGLGAKIVPMYAHFSWFAVTSVYWLL